jgi:hypothetical protein
VRAVFSGLGPLKRVRTECPDRIFDGPVSSSPRRRGSFAPGILPSQKKDPHPAGDPFFVPAGDKIPTGNILISAADCESRDQRRAQSE